MIRRFLLIPLFILVTFSFTFIANAQTNSVHDNKIETKNIYNEKQLNITVDANQPNFTIQLKSNPTTGYSWFLREYNNHLLTPVKHMFVAPENKAMGASGNEVWTFKVKPEAFTVPQQTTLRFIYARPWQGTDNASQIVFRITIH